MSNSTNISDIENHWKTNYGKLVKKYTRPAGTVWDAEDVVQTAYERALKYYGGSRIDNFDGWFVVILRNALIDHLNESRGITNEEFDEFQFESVNTIDHHVLTQTITQMIEQEHENNQPILILHFLQGYGAREIYEFNKLTYPNTRKIIQRFRDKLRKELGIE